MHIHSGITSLELHKAGYCGHSFNCVRIGEMLHCSCAAFDQIHQFIQDWVKIFHGQRWTSDLLHFDQEC